MVVYGLVASVSIGRLYAGGVFPGLLLSGLFCIYILIRSALQPHIAPAIPPEDRVSWKEKLLSLKSVTFPVLLIIAILGGIFAGIASVSEAAAIGAFGSMLCTAYNRKLNLQLIREASEKTLLISCLIFWIIIGASAFSVFYTAMGAADFMKDLALSFPVNRWVILIIMQIILIILGMVMETTGILMVTIPVFAPIILALGFDPVWFGVLFIVNMEMGFLTPPFGYNLFYLKGVAPEGITMLDIYRAIVPFVFLQLIGLILCMVFPQIILFLPNLIFGK
jgi:tripartite ATP-independent transporter DctM subunit